MSFSTEQIVFHDQTYADRPDPRICAWFDLNKIAFGYDIKNHKYAKIGFTGSPDKQGIYDTIIITFHKTQVEGSIKL